MQAIDIFSGVGGMSTGAIAAGIEIKYAVESDILAARAYELNHPNTVIIRKDIREVTIKDFPNIKKKNPLILFGGPPCQGFSTSNQKTRNSNNSDNWLFLEYTRVANFLKPDWLIFENVKGLKETEGGIFLEKILTAFKQLGFSVSFFILNAANFGVPQKRERLFVIGARNGIELSPPDGRIKKPITVAEAFQGLPSLNNGADIDVLPYTGKVQSKFAMLMRKKLRHCSGHLVTKNSELIVERYKHVPQGGNWENIPEKLMQNYSNRMRCHTGIYHRLKENFPSIVVGNFRKNMLIHPWENRGLSIREAARLQSFPDDFKFAGSIGFQQQQVGNAVPPLLAKAVFDLILENS